MPGGGLVHSGILVPGGGLVHSGILVPGGGLVHSGILVLGEHRSEPTEPAAETRSGPNEPACALLFIRIRSGRYPQILRS